MEGLVSEQSPKRSCGEGSPPFILHAVDRVRGALQPAVPRQDVFEVTGLEFYVLKQIRGVLHHVSCGKWEQGEHMGTRVLPPARQQAVRPEGGSSTHGPETLPLTSTALLLLLSSVPVSYDPQPIKLSISKRAHQGFLNIFTK